MSMRTTQEWHSHAQTNISDAFASQKKANNQMDSSRKAHRETVDDNLSAYTELHGSLEQKIRLSNRLIEKLEQRAKSMAESIQQTRQSQTMVEAAHRAKEPTLKLCLWRLEEREKRPLREQVRDQVELCLEEEKLLLMDTQRKMAESIRKTRAMINQLESKLEEVHQDIGHKSQALGVDEMCLHTTHRSYQTVVERTPMPSPRRGSPHLSGRLPSAVKTGSLHQQVALHESNKNEVNRQMRSTQLNQSAAGLEELAKELRDENSKLCTRGERSAMEAEAKAERMLQERINTGQKMLKRLEGEIRDTHVKTDHFKRTISETRGQMQALEEPIELTSTCASWRTQRAVKEHITDPVSTKLSEHQNMLLKSHEHLRGQHENERSLLGELNERRQRLTDDLRDKTAALHLDLNCLAHESVVLNGKGSKSPINKAKLSRALKVDANFVPMSPQLGRGNLGSIPYTPLSAR